MHCTWGPACRQMVLIHPAPPAYSTEGSLAEGKRRNWCEDDRVKGKEGSVAGGPPSVLQNLYLCSSFRPRRPQSRQHRNRRCRFLSWCSHSGTGARGRLTGALRGREKKRIGGKGYERVGGMGDYFLIWEITFWNSSCLGFFSHKYSLVIWQIKKKKKIQLMSLNTFLDKFLSFYFYWFTSCFCFFFVLEDLWFYSAKSALVLFIKSHAINRWAETSCLLQ